MHVGQVTVVYNNGDGGRRRASCERKTENVCTVCDVFYLQDNLELYFGVILPCRNYLYFRVRVRVTVRFRISV